MRVETPGFERVSAALKKAADTDVKTAVGKALRDIGKPYGKYVLLRGAAELPKKGGLSYRVAGASISVSASAERTQITVRARHAALGAMNAGILRHPTFGHKPWVDQSIRVGIFSTPFREGLPQIRTAMVKAVDDVLKKVAAS